MSCSFFVNNSLQSLNTFEIIVKILFHIVKNLLQVCVLKKLFFKLYFIHFYKLLIIKFSIIHNHRHNISNVIYL